jgi:hypothetical protein
VGASVDLKITSASLSPDVIYFFNTYVVFAQVTHLNCTVIYYSTTCLKISMWNSYLEQMEVDLSV